MMADQEMIECCLPRHLAASGGSHFGGRQGHIEHLKVVNQTVLEAAVPKTRADRQRGLFSNAVARRAVVCDVLI
jgi:hypothetical protein